MEKSANRQILDQWCDRVWRDRDESAIHELFSNHGKAGGMGRKNLAGPNDFVPFHQAMCNLLTNTKLHIDYAVEQGNSMFVLSTFTGNCAATGIPAVIEGSMSVQFEGGKILHCVNHFEFMSLFEQLGLLPENSFEALMAKRKMAVVGV